MWTSKDIGPVRLLRLLFCKPDVSSSSHLSSSSIRGKTDMSGGRKQTMSRRSIHPFFLFSLPPFCENKHNFASHKVLHPFTPPSHKTTNKPPSASPAHPTSYTASPSHQRHGTICRCVLSHRCALACAVSFRDVLWICWFVRCLVLRLWLRLCLMLLCERRGLGGGLLCGGGMIRR